MLALEQFHFHVTKSKLVSVKCHFPDSESIPILRIFTLQKKNEINLFTFL